MFRGLEGMLATPYKNIEEQLYKTTLQINLWFRMAKQFRGLGQLDRATLCLIQAKDMVDLQNYIMAIWHKYPSDNSAILPPHNLNAETPPKWRYRR